MSWTLESPGGARLDVNAWEWRPTLALLERAAVLDGDTLAVLGCNGRVPLTGKEAARIAHFLDGYLAGLPSGGRVRLGREVTTEPDTYELHRDLDRNYAASVAWLRAFRDFCRAAPDGFTCG